MMNLSATRYLIFVFFGLLSHFGYSQNCSPDRMPPVFDSQLPCDTVNCGDHLPTALPTATDACSSVSIFEETPMANGDYTCQGSFLVYGTQDMPDEHFVLASHSPLDTISTLSVNGLNGIGYYCNDTTGAHLYGLWQVPTNRSDTFTIGKAPTVWFSEVGIVGGQVALIDTLPAPPMPAVAGANQVAFSGPSNHIGDVGGGNFYFNGFSGVIDTVTNALLEVHLYIGTIPLGNVCGQSGGLNVSYTEINLDAVCTGYFLNFAAQVTAFLQGLISFPSGGFQDWASNPAGTALYTFMGVENALMRIDVLIGNATCIPGPATNVTNGYVGMTGVLTDEMAGMYFNSMGVLHAFQSDRGRIFSVDINTAELTLVDDLNMTDLRGDAASCTDCNNSVFGPCPMVPVQRRIIRATDVSNNANYQFQYIYPEDTSGPVLNCMDTTVVLYMGCDTVVTIHAPSATDNCAGNSLTYMVVSPTPLSTTDTTATFRLEVGNNEIIWAAMDCAGNLSNCSMNAMVIQPVAPAASCKNTNISLGDPCQIEVTPIMVYAGDTTNFCPSNFAITLRDKYGQIIPGNILTGAYVGQVIEVTLTVVQTGNSCWGNILVEDKHPPTISCQNDTMDCLTFEHNFTLPIAADNCGTAEAIKIDEQIIPMPCDTYFVKRIEQKWVARDQYGTLSRDTCTKSVWVRRLSLDSVQFPMDTVLDCAAGFATLSNGAPDPLVSGVPLVGGIPIYPNPEVYCNVLVSFRDDVIPEVGCRQQVIRVWRVEEMWCNANPVRTMTQVLNIVDTTGPEMSLDKEVIQATTQRRSCTANVWLPTVALSDACHKVSGLLIHYPGGVLNTNGGYATLPVGTHWAVYEAFDACYNRTLDSVQVIVRDQTAPVAVCKTYTTVSLDNLGNGWARAEDLDQGSFDECALDHLEVRRMSNLPCSDTDPVWGPSVRFCCEDVGTEVMVAFRAVDRSNNAGTCMVSVQVQDKLPPVVQCLPDITVDCRFDWDPEHLEVFGELVAHDSLRMPIIIDADSVRFSGPAFDGVASDNCPMTVTEELDTSDINSCGLGTITRRFIVSDAQGSINTSCVQTITVINAHPVTQDSILWPKDYLLADSCSLALFDPSVLPDSSNFPKLQDDECSLIGWDFTDDTLRNIFAVDACVKIIRHWRVIDWCHQDPTTGTFVRWDSVQILKLVNTVAPTFTSSCMDTMKCSFDPNCGPAPITLMAMAMDDCTPESELFWQYQIDLGNDGTYDIYGRDSNHVSGTFAIDTHRIRWIVEDKCGNVSDCSYTFELRNCKAPTAYCRTDVVYELDSVDTDADGRLDAVQAMASAVDFDGGSTHPCGYPVALSFSADTTDTTRVFTCADIGIVGLEFWVTDRVNGNTSKCAVQAVVQDNNGNCVSPLKGDISGQLKARNGDNMSGTEVYLDHSGGQVVQTDASGQYRFGNMPFGGSYRVRPVYDKEIRNGVSTRDLVAIKKYLLGYALFDDPLDYIAADANGDRRISTADLLAIRRVVLRKVEEFDNNTSWRFVYRDYQFPDPQNPFKYTLPEAYDFDPFDASAKVDFTGIKVGDVTGDARFNLEAVTTRGEKSVNILLKEEQLEDGRQYEVPVFLSDILDVEGIQMTLDFDPADIEIVDLIPNSDIGFSEANFNLGHLGEGMLPVSWVRSGDVISKRMFTLVIRAKSSKGLSEMFGVSDRFIRSESYLKNYKGVGGVQLSFRKTSGQTRKDNFFALYQNRPNPWSQKTAIGFYLPEEDDAQLSIWSHTGKLLKVIRGHYNAGYSEVIVHRSGLPSSGTLIYELKTSGFKATKKMVLME